MPLDFIKQYAEGKTILDKQYAAELYNFLRSFYSVEDFVKSMDYKKHPYYFAFYSPYERRLVVNFDKIFDDVNNYVDKLNIDNKDKVLALHLCFFHFMNHEFKHILQEKEKKNNPNSVESRVLCWSEIVERYYIEDEILYSNYGNDPIERQANLSSLRELIAMFKSSNINALVNEMTDKYQRNAICGYYSGGICPYPAKGFLGLYKYMNHRIEKLLEELDEYPITQNNLQTRIELGLNINEEEREKLGVKKRKR